LIFALILAAYTNHAGLVLSGVPVRVEAKTVTLSNAQEVVRVPFSIFPESERRRLAADGGSTQFVPQDVVRAVEGMAKAIRRADNRLAQNLVSQEGHDALVSRAHEANARYLDKAVSEGTITARERQLLERPHVAE